MSSIRVGAAWAGLGGAVAILLPLLMFILFARSLPAAVIGQFALAVALAEVLKMLGLPGLYEAMLQRRDSPEADQRLSSLVFLAAGVLLVPAHIGLLHMLLGWTDGLPAPADAPLLWLVALRIPLDLALLQPQAELARRQAFARLAQRNITANAGAAALGLAGVLAGWPLLGLAGYTLGLSVFAALATVWGTGAWRPPRWSGAAWRGLAPEAWPATAVRGAAAVSIQVDQLALGAWLGPLAFAHYNFGKRIELAYVSLATSFSQVLFQPLFAARQGLVERGAALRQALGLVTVTAGAGAAVFIATADLVVPLLLGPGWAPAAGVAALLALSGYGRALASACAALLSVSGGNALLFRGFVGAAAIGLVMVALAAPWGAMAVAVAVVLRVLGTTLWLAWRTQPAAGGAWRAGLGHAGLGFLAMLAAAVAARLALAPPGAVVQGQAAVLAVVAAGLASGVLALAMLLRLAPRARLAAP